MHGNAFHPALKEFAEIIIICSSSLLEIGAFYSFV
jgi:hypothetical protein